jgi:hypothetical protein
MYLSFLYTDGNILQNSKAWISTYRMLSGLLEMHVDWYMHGVSLEGYAGIDNRVCLQEGRQEMTGRQKKWETFFHHMPSVSLGFCTIYIYYLFKNKNI